jgi:hypothetical protein
VNHRKLALGTLVVVALGLLMASPTAWAALVKAADWRMNERSGRLIDSSRHNHGSPKHVVRTGSTYVFNGSTSRVAVPDDKSLDPAARRITLRASVRVAGRRLDDDSYDVVRKGLSGTPGGDYKMEIKRTRNPTVGKLHCFFRGTNGKVNRVAQARVHKDAQLGRGEGGREVLHAEGLGRLDLQPKRSPHWSQNDEPTRRRVSWLDEPREHRRRQIER